MVRLIIPSALTLLFVATGALAQDTEQAAADPAYLAYAASDHTATLADGRKIQIVCMGEGAPTVILTAGMGNWGPTWRAVHGPIAEQTRACTWDRPGFGFSDASPVAQTTVATTSDLEEALASIGIDGPYVMAGHSLGGSESLLFADRNPGAVVGIILVDSVFPDQAARFREVSPVSASIDERGLAMGMAYWRKCASDLESGQVGLGAPDPQGCLRLPSDYPPAIAEALTLLASDPRRPATRASLFENILLSTALFANPDRDYGDMPIVVLTAGEEPTDITEDMTDWPAQSAAWLDGHRDLAALSSKGVNRIIPDAGHYIQIDRPDVVIAAILEVVEAARNQETAPPP